MPSNERRARWADHALTVFQVDTRCDRQDALPDLLCDLMHLADREGWDFYKAVERAHSNHADEVANPEPEPSLLQRPRPFVVRGGPR